MVQFYDLAERSVNDEMHYPTGFAANDHVFIDIAFRRFLECRFYRGQVQPSG